MSERILLVSDAHLDPREPGRTESLIRLLRREQPYDRLLVLGDLFDFWFGYHHVFFGGYLPVLTELARLRTEGVEITYIEGNHDIHMGPLFTEQLGVDVRVGGVELDLDGRRAYLCHGERIDRRDFGNRILCSIVQNRWTQAAFRWLHPDLAWRLGTASATASRRYGKRRRRMDREVYHEFLEQRHREGFDIVIHGHTHEPMHRLVEYPSGKLELLNPGDWLRHFTYATYQEGHFQLHRDGSDEP